MDNNKKTIVILQKAPEQLKGDVYSSIPLMQSKLEHKGICILCGKKLLSKYIKAILHNNKGQYIIGTVPVNYCDACHIGYASHETSEKIRKQYHNYRAKMFMIGNGEVGKLTKNDLLKKIHSVSNRDKNGIRDTTKKRSTIDKRSTITEVKSKHEENDNLPIIQDNETLYVGDSGPHLCAGPMSGTLYDYHCFLNEGNGKRMQVKVKKCIRCGKIFVSEDFYEKWKSSLKEYNYLTNQGEKILRPEEFIHDIHPSIFLTRANVFHCSERGHELIDIRCRVKILTPIAVVKIVEIPAAYCPKCKKYFILESEYQRLKKQGIIICKVVEQGYELKESKKNDYNLNEESILHIMGYNVNARNNLSKNIRWKLLEIFVDEGVLTRMEICSHLDSLIGRSKNRVEHTDACEKWKADRDHIAQFDSDRLLVIEANAIVNKKRLKD